MTEKLVFEQNKFCGNVEVVLITKLNHYQTLIRWNKKFFLSWWTCIPCYHNATDWLSFLPWLNESSFLNLELKTRRPKTGAHNSSRALLRRGWFTEPLSNFLFVTPPLKKLQSPKFGWGGGGGALLLTHFPTYVPESQTGKIQSAM